MNADKRLLQLLPRLEQRDLETLVALAEFLAARNPADSAPVELPRQIARPEQETVVAAIKRLSMTYHMVDRSKMLHQTSGLMAEHLMQGREASEVIDELEVLFRSYYERLLGNERRES